jgi:ubiquinone/menaquinone biosynthesis C-methylase UbiE
MKKKILNPSWPSLGELWKDFKPPLRPSKGELKIYDEYLKKVNPEKKRLSVLMFGSTPELRDLLSHHKLIVTIVDANPEMVRLMSKLVRKKNKSEKVIIGNWLDLDFDDNSFDFAVGDQVLNNVDIKDWPKMLGGIKRVLRPGGYFLSDCMINPYNNLLTVKNFYTHYSKNKKWYKNCENAYLKLYNLAYTDSLFWYPDKQYMIWPSFETIKDAFEKNGISVFDKELEKIIFKIHGKFLVYSPNRKDFENILSQYFKIISSKINMSHPVFKGYRIYLFQSVKK